MYISKTNETGKIVVFENIIEDLQGGATLFRSRLNSIATEVLAGAPIYVSGGKAEIVKTAKVVAGGSAQAPRIEKEHHFLVGEFMTDGRVSTEITAITTTETDYDTVTLTAALELFEADQILYEGSEETSVDEGEGEVSAKATVEEAEGKTLLVEDLKGLANGVKLVLEQAGDDNLAVAYTNGVLTISLADTTGTKNTAVLIQAAIIALGVKEGVDFSNFKTTGTGWTSITGGTITTASDVFAGGVATEGIAPLYVANALLKSDVNVENANPSCACVIRGTAREANLPYPLTDKMKDELTSRINLV